MAVVYLVVECEVVQVEVAVVVMAEREVVERVEVWMEEVNLVG